MSKIININTKIYDLIKSHPEISYIMQDIGFDNVTSPVMLNTVGKVMTLKKGAKMKNINHDYLINKFRENGFELEDIDE